MFGHRDDTPRTMSKDEQFNYVEPAVIRADEIDWNYTLGAFDSPALG
jgi:hypothetical protein